MTTTRLPTNRRGSGCRVSPLPTDGENGQYGVLGYLGINTGLNAVYVRLRIIPSQAVFGILETSLSSIPFPSVLGAKLVDLNFQLIHQWSVFFPVAIGCVQNDCSRDYRDGQKLPV